MVYKCYVMANFYSDLIKNIMKIVSCNILL